MRSTFFKLLCNIGLLKAIHHINRKNRRIAVLCFHRITDERDYGFPAIRVALFVEIIEYLIKYFNIISLEETEHYNHSKQACVITFDDGYKDFMYNALPVLKKYGLPSVQNVVVESVETGKAFWTIRLGYLVEELVRQNNLREITLDKEIFEFDPKTIVPDRFFLKLFKKLIVIESDTRCNLVDKLFADLNVEDLSHDGLLTWSDLKECIEYNVNIGSHTYTHDSLISINNPEKLKKELLISKHKIENRLGIAVNTIAFPNGRYNEKILEETEKAGYKYALLVKKYHNIDTNKYESLRVFPRVALIHDSLHENLFNIEYFHDYIYSKIKKVKE